MLWELTGSDDTEGAMWQRIRQEQSIFCQKGLIWCPTLFGNRCPFQTWDPSCTQAEIRVGGKRKTQHDHQTPRQKVITFFSSGRFEHYYCALFDINTTAMQFTEPRMEQYQPEHTLSHNCMHGASTALNIGLGYKYRYMYDLIRKLCNLIILKK